MADNLTLPLESGTVASDDIGGVMYQRVKLALGADGAAADLAPGQAAMAASVPVVIASDQSALSISFAASETVIGLVGSSDIVVTVTPTCDTSAYASGDLIFDSTAIANAVRVNGSTAILQSITLLDKGDQGIAMTLIFANAATDFGTLNSAPDPDDTESATVLGIVRIAESDYIDLGANRVATISNIGLMLKAGAATTSLYVAGVNSTGTPTYGASDLVFQFGFLRA